MGEMTDRELLVTLVKNLELMRAELTAFKDEVRTMFRQQSDDMQTLKNDVQALKNDVQTLKNDVETLKADVQTLKNDVQMLKNEVQTLNNKFDRLERDVKETHRRTLHLETKFYESGTL